jgi:hypothetical protein
MNQLVFRRTPYIGGITDTGGSAPSKRRCREAIRIVIDFSSEPNLDLCSVGQPALDVGTQPPAAASSPLRRERSGPNPSINGAAVFAGDAHDITGTQELINPWPARLRFRGRAGWC